MITHYIFDTLCNFREGDVHLLPITEVIVEKKTGAYSL